MKTIVPWEPFVEVEPVHRMMERLIGNWQPFGGNGDTDFGYFPLDVSETNDGFELTASLPGVKPEEMEIQIQGNTVTIKATTTQETEHQDARWLRRERRVGSFQRSVMLPTELDPNKVVAHLEQGVLKLSLPKSEAVKPKTIKIA